MFRGHMGALFLLFCLLINSSFCFPCYPYVLENECSVVVNASSLQPEEQEYRFNLLSLFVSDIRMVEPSCRRPFLSLLCSFSFSFTCDFGEDIDPNNIIALVEAFFPACEEVTESCSFLNCSQLIQEFAPFFVSSSEAASLRSISSSSLDFLSISSSSSSRSSSSSSAYYVLDADDIPPIPVTTCLSDYDETTACCYYPFTRGDNGECRLDCPLPFFSKETDLVMLILMYIGVLSTVPILIFCLLPVWFTPSFHKFPMYALPLSIVGYTIASFTQTWSLFVWPPNYLCSGEEDYFSALMNLSESNLCAFQNWMAFFFVLHAEWWVGVVIFFTTTLMSPHPPSFIAYFLDKRGERIVHICGLIYALFFSLTSSIGAQLEDQSRPFGPYYVCVVGFEGWGYLFWIPFAGLFGVVCIFFFCNLCWVFFFRGNKALIYLHWRLFAFSIWSILVHGIIIVNSLYATPRAFDEYADRYARWIGCVTLNPRDENSGCELESIFAAPVIGAFCVVVFFWSFVSAILAYFSPPVFEWWKQLITTRKLPQREKMTPTSSSKFSRSASIHSKRSQQSMEMA